MTVTVRQCGREIVCNLSAGTVFFSEIFYNRSETVLFRWVNVAEKKLKNFFKVAKNLAGLTAKIRSRKTEEHIVTLEEIRKTFSNTSKSVVLERFNDGRKKLRKFFK